MPYNPMRFSRTKRMITYRTLFWALVIALVRYSTSLSRRYTAKLDLDNNIFQGNLLTEYDAHSLIMCSTMCGQECTYFGVNLQRKKCRLHTGCHSTNLTIQEVGWRYYGQETEENRRPMNCKNLFADCHTISGVYTIYPWNTRSVDVHCDMDTQDGGWTVIQRRFDGTIDFSRPWNEYKEGFGSVHSSYWIGNDVIHQLTKNRPSLYVSITLTNGTILYQKYETFSVSDETDKYRLYLAGSTEGTLGDSLHHHKGMSFSTSDLDNDMWSANCAAYYGGGWWFNSCHHAYLNGPWSPAVWSRPWYPTVGNGREIKETLIMIKPH